MPIFQFMANRAAIALFALVVLLVSPKLINSDSASILLLAEELLRNGSLVSADWIYVSDNLGLDGRTQVAMLGVLAFGLSIEAYIFSVFTCAALGFLAAAWFARVLGATRENALSAAIILFTGPSLIYYDMVLGMMIGTRFALTFLFAGCLVRYVFANAGLRYLVLAIAIMLLMATSATRQALSFCFLPAMAALVAAAIASRFDPAGAERWPRIRLAGLALPLAMLAGYGVHAALVSGLRVDVSRARLAMDFSPAHVLGNVADVAELYLRFAGDGNSLMGAATVVLASAALLVILGVSVLRIVRKPGLAATPVTFAAVFGLAGLAIVLAYLAGYQTIRKYYGIYYAIVPLAPLVCVAAASAGALRTALANRLASAALIASLLVGVLNSAWLLLDFPKNHQGVGINQLSTHAEQMALVHWLEQHGARHGHADFWNANAITLLSEGRIRATPMRVRDRGRRMVDFRWLVSRYRLAHEPAGDETWFIVLPERRMIEGYPAACLSAATQYRAASYRVNLYRGPRPGCFSPNGTSR